MSLVIAKIIDEKIYIESDSRVSDINEGRKESLFGVLKSIIFYPRLCIAYAGSIYLAEKAVKEIFDHKNSTLPYLVETLLRYNSEGNQVEFIINSFNNNKPNIIKISHGQVDINITSAWLGDNDGFNDFQKNFHELKGAGISIRDAMGKAFAKVIDNPFISSVGDFQVSTITETGPNGHLFFRYFEKFSLNLGELDGYTISSGEERAMTWGTAAGGSYGICYFVSTNAWLGAIAYYFVHGNFGVLFCPKIKFEGIVIKDKNNIDFLKFINDEYKMPMRGFRLINNSGMQLVDMRFPDKFN